MQLYTPGLYVCMCACMLQRKIWKNILFQAGLLTGLKLDQVGQAGHGVLWILLCPLPTSPMGLTWLFTVSRVQILFLVRYWQALYQLVCLPYLSR